MSTQNVVKTSLYPPCRVVSACLYLPRARLFQRLPTNVPSDWCCWRGDKSDRMRAPPQKSLIEVVAHPRFLDRTVWENINFFLNNQNIVKLLVEHN